MPIVIGPTRHGVARGETIYFVDPSGNRNEVFSGGYIYCPDKPTITWTDGELRPAIFYHEKFPTVFTQAARRAPGLPAAAGAGNPRLTLP